MNETNNFSLSILLASYDLQHLKFFLISPSLFCEIKNERKCSLSKANDFYLLRTKSQFGAKNQFLKQFQR